jgi:hypothetical protein
MDRPLAGLEAIVRNRICRVCTDRTVEGQCALEEPSNCALFRLFPQVVQAIQSVTSHDIHPYIEAIRRNVCAVCAGRASGGSCEIREPFRCSLDAYLSLVVETIGVAIGKTIDKSRLQPAGGPLGIRPNPQIPL